MTKNKQNAPKKKTETTKNKSNQHHSQKHGDDNNDTIMQEMKRNLLGALEISLFKHNARERF